ncbi:nucleoplasmin-2 isoform X2 [Suricata suricatta]|uniref:nucleoplasmin-2 isoform X2 n=1 Tax=Suricata suricatta TaxID=37032 RepID=UPI0011554061|nr:nucleoplasmin-2 isoform X2 [Suricata suricatta]
MRAVGGNWASSHRERPFLAAAGTRAPAPRVMNRSRTSSAEKAPTAVLWGCELNQDKRTWTVKPQKEGKQDCKLLLSTICLGEKAKEEMNLVEILHPASQEDKKTKPITIASLQASVLPMVMMGLELSPPVTFQLRAGSGPVFLSGQECYDTSDLSWGEEEEEEDLEEEEEEEDNSDDDDDDDDDDVDVDVSVEEETPVKQVKRLASQKQTGVAKAKLILKPKKPGSKK